MYKALIKFKERSRDKKNYNTKINNIQYCNQYIRFANTITFMNYD